jgi:hypothetical protein
VHHVRIQVVQPRDRRGRSIRLPTRLKDLSLEPRTVLATGRPLNHAIYCVHIIHRGHDACRLSGNQDDFTARLLINRCTTFSEIVTSCLVSEACSLR